MAGLFRFSLLFALLGAVPFGASGTATAATDTRAPRAQAAVAFQRDLVSVLAPRADALPLLGAALLARPLKDQPKGNDFHSLIERATQASGHGPAQSWVQLTDCDAVAEACPNPRALQALLRGASDNAAVWLLKLGQDVRVDKPDLARADLAHAASARFYDDYTGTSLKALANVVSVLPPPSAAIGPDGAGAAGLQAVIVFGMGSAQPQPGLQAAAGLCDHPGKDKALKTDCLKLGKLLEWGSSPLARSLGLHLREELAADPAQQQQARRERRDLVWQVRNFARLCARMPADKALATHLLALARHGGTEMSLLLAALRDAGLPTQAPAEWKERHPG